MKLTTDLKKNIVTGVKIVAIVEIVYLVVLNLALQLPVTQSLVNAIKPEKFHVSWETAWTWYPFRVHARGIAANGQSRSQQWQLDAAAASGSIAVLPLVLKRVWLSDIVATDASYFQRPRLRADQDYQLRLPYYPEIAGREIIPAETAPRKTRRPWHLSISNIRLQGRHNYWIHQFRGSGTGHFQGDLTFETRGGPFSLTGNAMDLHLETLYVNDDEEMFRSAHVAGTLGFAPFIPRQSKGIELLKYLLLDVDLDVDANSLQFISVFTKKFGGLEIDGRGLVDGQIHMDRGTVIAPTALKIVAEDLRARLLEHDIRGSGTIDMVLGPTTNDLLELELNYKDLAVVHVGDTEPLVSGRDLRLEVRGDEHIFRDPETVDEGGLMKVAVDKLTIPDLALFQRYLPEKWLVHLYGGEGQLDVTASVMPNAMHLALDVSSDDASIGIRQYRFNTDLEFALRLDNPSLLTDSTSIKGSYIKLSDAVLQNSAGSQGVETADSTPWGVSVLLKDGDYSLLNEAQKRDQKDVIDLLELLGSSGASQLLGDVRGAASFEAQVSSLEWIGVLLDASYAAGVNGSGTVEGVIGLESGRFAPGTRVNIVSPDLSVEFLDYSSTGQGTVRLDVKDRGGIPAWFLDISLTDADLRRAHEKTSLIQDVALTMEATIEDIGLLREKDKLQLRLQILSANVTDMSIFNGYLPPEGPLKLAEGVAALSADILLYSNDAKGWVKLTSDDVTVQLDDQAVSLDLGVDINLTGGVPANMQFDISGSEVRLSDVRVKGEKENFHEDLWSATVLLVRGETTWTVPLKLNAEADIVMRDSRPVVAMFNNHGWKPKWLSNMLTVEDIRGTMKVRALDKKIIVPYAYATSDNINLGGKGSIEGANRNGIIYARYKKFNALLKISDGKKNLDLINARKKFEQYQAVQSGRPTAR